VSQVCRYATGRQDRLIMHMRDHGEMFCLYCDYSTAQLSSYRTHVQSCAAAGSRNVTYWGEWSLLAAEVGQFSEQERTCRLCNVIFAQQCDLETHVYLVHVDTSSDEGLLSCRACGLATRSENQMEEHLVSHAPDSYSCVTRGCNFRAIYARTLELHQKYYHSPAADELVTAPLPVITPSHPLPSGGGASDVSYSAVGPVQSGATSTTSSLSPVSIMHGVGQFSCPMCADRPPFKYRRSFEKHLTQHSANVQVCPLCVESFMSRGDLQTHMLVSHGASVV